MVKLFRRISKISRWYETRFSSTGRSIFVCAIIAAIFGADPRQTLAFYFAAMLISTLFVAFLSSLRWRPQLRIERHLPETVSVGASANYLLVVTNLSAKTERDLVLIDRLRTRYPDREMLDKHRAHNVDIATNWVDRKIGFPRWLALLRRGRGAFVEELHIDVIGPGESIKLNATVTPTRRGKIVFSDIIVKRPDPLSICFALCQFDLAGEFCALPRRYPVPVFNWQSQRHFHHGGLSLAATVGDSEEFIGMREYRPGDPLRHIHWRSFAKQGQPIIKEFQDEYFDRHALILDNFCPAQRSEDFEAALSVAASLIQTSRPRDSLLDLVFADERVWRLTIGRGLSRSQQILRELAELSSCSEDRFDELVVETEAYIDRLASVVIVATSWNELRQQFVDRLAAQGLNSVALIVGSNSQTVGLASQRDERIVSVDSTDIAASLATIAK